MNLRPGLEVEMYGFNPPCPYGTGCMNSLQAAADMSGATFIYRKYTMSGKEAVYHFIPEE
jgi:hypothetical protein